MFLDQEHQHYLELLRNTNSQASVLELEILGKSQQSVFNKSYRWFLRVRTTISEYWHKDRIAGSWSYICSTFFWEISNIFKVVVPVCLCYQWMSLPTNESSASSFMFGVILCFRVHKYRKFEWYFPVALICISLTVNGFEPIYIFSYIYEPLIFSYGKNAYLCLCPPLYWISNWFVGLIYLLY